MKELFPVYKTHPNMVYLDNAASALKPYKVIDAINNYYLNYSTNIERGVYKISLDATRICEEAREKVAKFINAKSEEIIYTRGCSQSLNMAASMISEMLKPGDEVITSELEHHSSFLPWLNLEKKMGIKVVFIPLDEYGRITVENFKKVLSDKTKVVAIAQVSNVLGYEAPVKEIVKISHEKGIICSIDGAQAIPHKRVNVKELDADFYSFSFHKMCGPTGLGILYGKSELLNKLNPVEFGGEMNDEVSKDSVTYKNIPYKFETGTMPIAEIFASSAAVDFIESIGYDYIEKRSKELAEKARVELRKMKEIVMYNDVEASPIIAFNVNGVHSHDSVTYLVEDNICLRAGHHCAEPLHKWLGISASLRASFYFYNDENDVKEFVEYVKKTVNFFKEVGYIE